MHFSMNMLNYYFLSVLVVWCTYVVSAYAGNFSEHPSWMLIDHEKCGSSAADRIIGGKNATIGSYPWVARIGYLNTSSSSPKTRKLFRCGGTLVNVMYVITAAHCVSNLPENCKVIEVRLGEHFTQTNPDCDGKVCADPVQDFTPAQIIVHRKYNDPKFKNDIAIIRLDRPINFTVWVKPICLPSGSLLEKNYLNETAEVAGWGIYDINEPKASTILQTIKLPIVPTERCAKAFQLHAEIGPEQICVGGQIGYDSCAGDSGGALMKVDQDETGQSTPKYFIIGIVSFGAKHCGQTTVPAVYTRVSKYVGWILDNISP